MSILSSSGKEGAAAVAPSPTTPEDAERLLDAATSPAQAWAIYEIAGNREEGWHAIKLKAERRYGELLGPAKRGNPNVTRSHIDAPTRKQNERARKVAAIPQDVFDAYLAETTKPTRNGLLRHGKPVHRLKMKTPPDEAVTRLRKRVAAVRNHGGDRPRWAWEDVGLVEAVLNPRTKSGATARLRVIATARKKDPSKLWDLRYNLMKLVGWLAQLDLLDWGVDQWDRDGIYDLYDDLVLLDEWTTKALARASSYVDDDGIRELIRKMKENQSGRTEAEKENIKRRVAALERKLENKLSA